MAYFNIVAETSENTVITEYTPVPKRSEAYQSEAELEKEFIRILGEQGYEYAPAINDEVKIIHNLRLQLEKLNDYTFTDAEWKRFFEDNIANKNFSIADKTRRQIGDEGDARHCERIGHLGGDMVHMDALGAGRGHDRGVGDGRAVVAADRAGHAGGDGDNH